MPIDWDDAFDNSGHVPGAHKLGNVLTRKAADFRARLLKPDTGETRLSPASGQSPSSTTSRPRFELDLAYGPAPRNRLDLFRPAGESRGLFVFIHGGYWHRLDKSYWSHLSAGMCQRGWTVAIPSYTLAPQARLRQITGDVGAAIAFAATRVAGEVRLAGHSAGGHLVSRMMCADSPLSADLRTRLTRVVSVSGIHDLRPLLATRMNDTLGLTADEAQSESPALLAPLAGIDVTFWVGAQERPELIRQTRLIAEKWERQTARVRSRYQAGRHHFSVIDALTQSDSALVREIMRPPATTPEPQP